MNALKDDGTIKLSVGVQCSWLFLLCLESVPVETWCLEQEDKRRECVQFVAQGVCEKEKSAKNSFIDHWPKAMIF